MPIFLALCGSAIFLVPFLGQDFFPSTDSGEFILHLRAKTGTRIEETARLCDLVENSIRHGLASKVDGGTIHVRSRLAGKRLQILVEDDGVGIPEAKLATLFDLGIGVNNVNERLKVLFGANYKMWIDSRPGEGTSTGIELPEQAGTVALVG